MKTEALLICLMLPVILFSYNWEQTGPADVAVMNYSVMGGGVLFEVYCTESGIYVNGEPYSYYGLMCRDVELTMGTGDEMLLALGDGTDSDGIYGFDIDTEAFTLYLWLMNPYFIEWCPADSSYYAGGEEGLFRSNDGQNWEAVSDLSMIYCYDMAIHDCNYIVGTAGAGWYSHDAGETWGENYIIRPIYDLEYNWDGWCYGIFPGESYSSGLYRTLDHGEEWEVEFWSVNMTSLSLIYDDPFVGWRSEAGTNFGVARWDRDTEELNFFNEGLGCYMINKITTNPIINTPNIVCCTDEGAWMLTNFMTESDENELPCSIKNACNYPNPFNPRTTICCEVLSPKSNVSLKIFNIKGQIVHRDIKRNVSAGVCRFEWNADKNGESTYSNGVYIYQISDGKSTGTGRMLLLK